MCYFLEKWKQIKLRKWERNVQDKGKGTVNQEDKQLQLLLPLHWHSIHPLSGDAGTVRSGVGGTVCKPSEVRRVFPSNWTSSILRLPTHSLSHPSPHVRFPRIRQTTHPHETCQSQRAEQAREIRSAHKSLEEFLSLSEGVIRWITAHKLWCINYIKHIKRVCVFKDTKIYVLLLLRLNFPCSALSVYSWAYKTFKVYFTDREHRCTHSMNTSKFAHALSWKLHHAKWLQANTLGVSALTSNTDPIVTIDIILFEALGAETWLWLIITYQHAV